MKQILNKILLVNRLNHLSNKKKLYERTGNDINHILTIQKDSFNTIWNYALKNIEFYSDYAFKHKLPNKIKDLDELNQFPSITKNQLIDFFSVNKNYLRNSIKTGGSSGKPAEFPFNVSDQQSSYLRAYLGRSRLNIDPFDKTALVWGHSHLFEKNFTGSLKYFARRLKDHQLNIYRLSAYNLSNASLDKYIKIISSRKIKFLIGYTSCIRRISERILESNITHDFGHLKSIVVTAETVDAHDIRIIEKAFKCDCHVEYGTAEAGVLGYSSNTDKLIHFFWDDYIYQINSSNNLIITSIYNRYFPLIRYDTEDLVEVKHSFASHIYVEKIIGRANDNLTIEVDSKKISVHSELLTHILKSIEDVKDFLITQKENIIEIQFVSEKSSIEEAFFRKLEKEYKNVNKKLFIFIKTSEVNKIVLPSGKKKWVIVEK